VDIWSIVWRLSRFCR